MYMYVHVNMCTSMFIEAIIEFTGVSSFSVNRVLGIEFRSSVLAASTFIH